MARIVLAVLALFSVTSWAIILAKYLTLKRVKRQNDRFRRGFTSAGKFSQAREIAEQYPLSTLAGHFRASYDEVGNQTKVGAVDWDLLEREMKRDMRQTLYGLRGGLTFLATTAGVTPFIGLFGTVWGIMDAFRQIGLTGSSSLATVAPGISEALVNTAAGLVAAIPALAAYNLFVGRLRSIGEETGDFSNQLLILLVKRLPRPGVDRPTIESPRR